MEKLSVRRARSYAPNRFQSVGKTEKASGAVKSQAVKTGQTEDLVSETLQKLMGSMDRVSRQVKEGGRTLHAGEAALAEVEETLERMEELARQAAQGETGDRDALQKELERLRGELDRIVQSGIREGLFQDGDGADDTGALVDALLNGLEAQRDGARGLPAWLLKGMAGPAPSRDMLLLALGVAEGASGAALLEALGRLPLENRAAGYLAGLYLGAVISGGVPSGEVDPQQAAQGLEQLLKLVWEGVSLDEAVELLTGGLFTGIEDFQAQFTGGTAPGLESFLIGLLQTGGGEPEVSLPDLLAGSGEGEVDLLMDLLMALEGHGEGAGLQGGAAPEDSGTGPAGGRPGGGGQQTSAAGPDAAAIPWNSARIGTVQALGRDLSGVSVRPEDGGVTVAGGEDLILRGQEQGQEAPALRLTGSGTLTLQQVRTVLTADAAQAKVILAGGNTLDGIVLGEGTALTLEGKGPVYINALRGGPSSTLHLAGGAFVLAGEGHDGRAVPLVADGPVFLLAPADAAVQNASGEQLSPMDVLWKTMLPGWSNLTSLMVDGQRRQLILTPRDHPDPLRLWLLRGNENQGYPAHSIVLQGRDQAGNLRVRYSYVRWDQRAGTFQEITMYPNPFTVTGGEEGVDWRYEEESQTLCLLTAQVSAVSGGTGTDGDGQSFSGRLALADGIGRVELTLEGVQCRVSVGRAFQLGSENEVTLLLQSGSENVFQSGPGFAGISLGPGTSLTIDRAQGRPEGKLTALGGSGGAGIGRDSGAGRGRQCGCILIRGGEVTAAGVGGGAGIGGALGAKAGDIRIQGGTVTAQANCCAAAIGAGIQGSCGDITFTSFAHVASAQGGGPDGDIGGCLFGGCGKLQVSSGAELGGAKLWNREGLSLQVGETALTLPKFRVSSCALRLDTVDLTTRERARAALAVLRVSRRWVGRLQGAYGMMYGQLAQSARGLYSAQQYAGVVREDRIADLLLRDARVVLRQDPLAPYRMRAMENAGLLLQ